MDILDDMGVSKLSAILFYFFKVNYSFKREEKLLNAVCLQPDVIGNFLT